MVAGLVLAVCMGAAQAEVEKGMVAPHFATEAVDGKKIGLSDFTEKSNLLLVVFSTGCHVSVGEMGSLEKIAKRYKPKRSEKGKEPAVVVIGVCQDDMEAKTLASWAKRNKLTFQFVLDSQRKIANAYEAPATPTFILIDKQGVIQGRYSGGGETIREALAADSKELVETGSVARREAPVPTRFG